MTCAHVSLTLPHRVHPDMCNSCFPAECIAEATFQRHPRERGGLLWRPGLPISSRSNLRTGAQFTSPLNFSFDFNPSQALAVVSPQHSGQAHSEGLSSGPGSLLVGLFGSSEVELQDLAAQAQAQAHTHAHATQAVSLNGFSPLSPLPSSSADTLEHCVPPRIKLEASGETAFDASASTSDPLMSSATSVQYAVPATSNPPRSVALPPPLAMPPISGSLADPPPGVPSSSLLSPLMPLPSPSIFQSSLHSPGLTPSPLQPSPFIPESPIAHARRAPSPARTPPMLLRSTASQHTLDVRLPAGLAPEMVTISVRKSARLAIVADLWHRENDCE